jgi:AcrR family transcriptional regulator
MAARDTSARPVPARPVLSRERVLDAAIALADAHGIEAVTMRRLADAVGAKPMSLYHHLANKEEVVDGMVDVVFSEIELPTPALGWKEAARLRARSARRVLIAHPWAVPLLESRRSPGPATLRHHDAVIGAYRENGVDIAMAAHAVSVVDAYVYGFVLTEAALPFDATDGEQARDAIDEILSPMDADSHPHLVELATAHVLQPGYSFAEEFDWGLDLVLDGLERRVAGRS